MVGRRRFILLGIGGGAAVLVGSTTLAAAADAPTVLTVWRLSADWGYAVPPKNRTRCRCQSCRAHAANKVFASKAVALANRIHPCCVCQPYSIELLASDAATLFVGSPSGDSIDLRDHASRALFEAAMARSLAPVSPSSPPAVPDTSMSNPAVPLSDHNVLLGALVTTSDRSRASASAAPASATLPVTGTDHNTLLTAATVLVAAGVAAVASTAGRESPV
jgi:hypothetical protein